MRFSTNAETPEIGAVQLHGKETPAQVASFAKRHPLVPVIKAIGVERPRDLDEAEAFEGADAFLFDAKPPAGATREGGHGKSFDWSILKGFRVQDHEDWTLSGGLTPENVAEAIRKSGAGAVDVSSGVEKSLGVKDKAKVEAFIAGPVPEGPAVLLTGEYTPMNLLHGGPPGGDGLAGMFDFGDGLVGPREYDWLGPLCFLAAGHAARCDAFMAGYGAGAWREQRLALMRLLLLHRYSHLPIQLATCPGWEAAPSFEALAETIWP